MAHLVTTLPRQIEIGAMRSLDWGTEVVELDSGDEVRNNRWSTPLRRYEINYPPKTMDDPVYLAVLALYAEAKGMLHSFDYTEWLDDTAMTVVPVRFDSPLDIVGITGRIAQPVSLVLKEVRT